MSNITVREAKTGKELKLFAGFANKLYKDNPNFVPELEQDVLDGLNPKKNPASSFTLLMPMLAYDNGNVVGRIVGIINQKANKKWGEKTVRFGLFDFIDDIRVADSLLKSIEQWGASQGMNHIEGPMGITDFDKEGMLVEDFNLPGSTYTYYNAAYYPAIMDKLNYTKRADWVQIRVPVPSETPPLYTRIAERAARLHHVRLIQITNKQIRQGWGLEVFHLFNQAYSKLFGFTEFTDKQAQMLINRYIWLVDKSLMPILVNEKDELVGAAITMGSLNNAMRKAKGKLLPFGWWHLVKSLLIKREDTVDMLLIGIRPDYQGTGINAMLFDHLIPVYQKFGFKWAETGPQLENNHRELTQWKYLNGHTEKRRRCYEKAIEL